MDLDERIGHLIDEATQARTTAVNLRTDSEVIRKAAKVADRHSPKVAERMTKLADELHEQAAGSERYADRKVADAKALKAASA